MTRYLPILLLLSGCMSPCVGGCDERGMQEILDMCKTRTDCFGGGGPLIAPGGDIITVPLIQPPSTVVIIPYGGFYGY